MNCLKAIGERIMSRDVDCQTAEIQIRIAIMNFFPIPGRADIKAVAGTMMGKAKLQPTMD